MSISKEEVEKIALLARLGLSEEEKVKFTTQLSSILDYVKQLGQVDTEGVEPSAQVTGLENVTREDEAEESNEEIREKLIKAAPETENGLIKARSVF
ncbi:Asp-tRNA(Asn)/Glu-tRNA(Gln) amidotransferase subunit GatC [Candidatus Falkowbacteria bacterium]|nr:Asp-tRNA(Asn)/Glu-tRNA(Gln) amidotransferase subunit GatC [Candidatus Falkowbacteria bacterium]